MRYFAKFDEQGNRITSIVEGVHFNDDETLQEYVKDGFVEITEEEQNLYQTNEYVRGTDGKPQKKPAVEPVPQEHEQIDSSILDMAETIVALNDRLQKLEGSTKA